MSKRLVGMLWSALGVGAWIVPLPLLAEVSAPVVVELFESQGCSSCPPAERAMEKLHEEFKDSMIPLTYHVDYWDSLGWKDTFSDARFTRRQQDYGRIFRQPTIYTPEMVVQGETGFVGSDVEQARKEIRYRLVTPRPDFRLKVTPQSSGVVLVSVQLASDLAGRARELVAVVYENAPPVNVLRGENRGEIMSGAFAARSLVTMPRPDSGHSSVTLTPGPWKSEDSSVVVLVRGSSSQIIAVESATLYPNSVQPKRKSL